MEFLFEFLGDFLLQAIGQGLVELGLHGIPETFEEKKARNPFLATFGFMFLGWGAGALSLIWFHVSHARSQGIGLLTVLSSAFVAGLGMAAVGAWRRRREKRVVKIETFFYGFVFAFSLGLTRFISG